MLLDGVRLDAVLNLAPLNTHDQSEENRPSRKARREPSDAPGDVSSRHRLASAEVVIQELDRRLKDARAGRLINIAFSMPAPVDQTGEDDRAIQMLELSVDDVIELGEDQFSNFVLDEWRWKQQVHTTNSMYTTGGY